MQTLRNRILLLLVIITSAANAQKQEAVSKYISEFKDLAVAEMKRTGVPAAITLAQGIHESGAGTSKLVTASNNHFGIKCKSNWTGESVKYQHYNSSLPNTVILFMWMMLCTKLQIHILS